MMFNFGPLHASMERQVEAILLPGVATAVIVGGEVVDTFCTGRADKEAGIALRADHIHRLYSSTKLITACAALLLWEEGRFGLDDPVESFIPQLGLRNVLRPGATRIDDVEPARQSITIRQLMAHTSGLSYGLFDPGNFLFDAYVRAKVRGPETSLAEKMDLLAPLPLRFEPGTHWEYSIASDVVARLVEVASGQAFGDFLEQRIFRPLGMVDTGFVVPPAEQHRLCAYYSGRSVTKPTLPGLVRRDDLPYPGAYIEAVPNQSGGGGLVSTLGDSVRLIKALLPGNETLLKPATVALMAQNQVGAGFRIKIPAVDLQDGLGFGLGSALVMEPGPCDPADSTGEYFWSGLGGTHWWVNPRANIAGVLMAQRNFGCMNPYAYEFRMEAYRAVGMR